MINKNIKTGIKIDGHKGTWGVIDSYNHIGQVVFLLEHDFYGEDAASLIVNSKGKIILDNVWNGFDDLDY